MKMIPKEFGFKKELDAFNFALYIGMSDFFLPIYFGVVKHT